MEVPYLYDDCVTIQVSRLIYAIYIKKNKICNQYATGKQIFFYAKVTKVLYGLMYKLKEEKLIIII